MTGTKLSALRITPTTAARSGPRLSATRDDPGEEEHGDTDRDHDADHERHRVDETRVGALGLVPEQMVHGHCGRSEKNAGQPDPNVPRGTTTGG